MRICIITTGFPTPTQPGRYAFVDQLACTWADMGQSVSVIYPIPAFVEYLDKKRFYKDKWERRTQKANTVSVRCPRFLSASDKAILGIDTKLISYRSFQKAIVDSIESMEEKPDVLYGHFLPSGCQAGDVGQRLRIPAFCAFGESSLWSISGWNINKVKNSLFKLSGIVSVSTENKRILVENELFREIDIEVVPNGVDHTLFRRLDKRKYQEKTWIS